MFATSVNSPADPP